LGTNGRRRFRLLLEITPRLSEPLAKASPVHFRAGEAFLLGAGWRFAKSGGFSALVSRLETKIPKLETAISSEETIISRLETKISYA
jgi:hypothetical protein